MSGQAPSNWPRACARLVAGALHVRTHEPGVPVQPGSAQLGLPGLLSSRDLAGWRGMGHVTSVALPGASIKALHVLGCLAQPPMSFCFCWRRRASSCFAPTASFINGCRDGRSECGVCCRAIHCYPLKVGEGGGKSGRPLGVYRFIGEWMGGGSGRHRLLRSLPRRLFSG